MGSSITTAQRAMMVAASVAWLAGCARPQVGAVSTAPARIELTAARVGGDRRVVVRFTVSKGGQPVPLAVARSLLPAFTLAGLAAEPVSGLAAWKSYLLLGEERLAALPVAGPGTPPELVLKDTRQPWFEDGGALEDQGVGSLAYTFCNSSGFKSFIYWVDQIRGLPKDQQYRLRFMLSPAKRWQRTSLLALTCFAVDIIEIAGG